MNEEAMASVGPQRHRKEKNVTVKAVKIFKKISCCVIYFAVRLGLLMHRLLLLR
jgi:hypothetical protein